MSPYDPVFQEWLQRVIAGFVAAGRSLLTAQQQALGTAYAIVLRQATAMSFIDCFWLMAVTMLALIPLVFIMRKPPRHTGPAGIGH